MVDGGAVRVVFRGSGREDSDEYWVSWVGFS